MILQSMLSGVWFIEEQKLLSVLPKLAAVFISRQKVLSQSEIEEATTVNISAGSGLYVISEFGVKNSPEDAPDGSIAVIGITDVICSSDDYYYGIAGTKTKNNLLQRALANPKIKGIIYYTNSPGGEAGAGERLVESARKTDKPIFTFVDGINASAAYHITAASSQIYITSEYNEVGSIGTYVTLSNMKGLMAKLGIDVLSVYASESTIKNIEVRDAFDKKNTDKLQSYVDHYQGLFKQSVIDDRGDRITDNDAYKGKLFLGSGSITAGLADGKLSFDSCVGLMEEHISRQESLNKKSYIIL